MFKWLTLIYKPRVLKIRVLDCRIDIYCFYTNCNPCEILGYGNSTSLLLCLPTFKYDIHRLCGKNQINNSALEWNLNELMATQGKRQLHIIDHGWVYCWPLLFNLLFSIAAAFNEQHFCWVWSLKTKFYDSLHHLCFSVLQSQHPAISHIPVPPFTCKIYC